MQDLMTRILNALDKRDKMTKSEVGRLFHRVKTNLRNEVLTQLVNKDYVNKNDLIERKSGKLISIYSITEKGRIFLLDNSVSN